MYLGAAGPCFKTLLIVWEMCSNPKQKKSSAKGVKEFRGALVFAFYCSFKKQVFEKKYEEFSSPYIPRFLLSIAFLGNNSS